VVDQMATQDGDLLDRRIAPSGLSHGETPAKFSCNSGGASFHFRLKQDKTALVLCFSWIPCKGIQAEQHARGPERNVIRKFLGRANLRSEKEACCGEMTTLFEKLIGRRRIGKPTQGLDQVTGVRRASLFRMPPGRRRFRGWRRIPGGGRCRGLRAIRGQPRFRPRWRGRR
jgi:hypothetical protein